MLPSAISTGLRQGTLREHRVSQQVEIMLKFFTQVGWLDVENPEFGARAEVGQVLDWLSIYKVGQNKLLLSPSSCYGRGRAEIRVRGKISLLLYAVRNKMLAVDSYCWHHVL